MVNIRDYSDIVGKDIVDGLFIIADKLKGKTIQNINSTFVGGGVAEILTRMIPLLKQLDVETHWNVIKGDERFFEITKAFHNALHGVNVEIKTSDLDYFVEVNRSNAEELNLKSDIVFIHDPQPICLIENKEKNRNKWAWRCHIDFTNPQKDVITFLEKYINKYDSAIFFRACILSEIKYSTDADFTLDRSIE